MKIVFMGTPEFAVPSLDILFSSGYEIVGVVTAPDKPAGRGQHLSQSAVKKYALENDLKLLQPEKLRNENFLTELSSLKADLQVVVAFRMLPAAVFTLPPLGCINVHASLLPNYKGAAPINWAIINGEKETGVTTFFIEQEIDAGNIIFQDKVKIENEETAGDLHDKLKMVGAQLLLKTVQGIESGIYPKIRQPEGKFPLAPKIFTETCMINWEQSSLNIHNLVRGLSPYPTAFTLLNNQTYKIFNTRLTNINSSSHPAGSVQTDQKNFLRVATSDFFIEISDLQPAGKKRLPVKDFLRGYGSLFQQQLIFGNQQTI